MPGYTDDVVKRHGMLDPGASYIEKPFTPADLSMKIDEEL
jgi:hypothetical protein